MDERYEKTFGKGKTGIGVVHLAPLPGSPGFGGDLAAVIQRAVREGELIEGAGLGAIIVENYGDLPFYRDRVGPETIASMAIVSREVRRACRVPVGVNVLRNDYEAALAIAGTCGCEFVRINILVGAYVTTEGMIEGNPARVSRLRERLAPEAMIFADILVKHAYPLAATGIGDDALDVVERGGADCVVVTGPRTGSPTSAGDLKTVRSVLEGAGMMVPIFVGSGVGPANAENLLKLSDGFIVGSYIRKGGRAGAEVDPERVGEIGKVLKEVAG
jgi:membrane complex biogenesis BtpA family protein